jgi:two-component system, cell cycle sensor histidine kinase and response regulator CckA
MTVHEAILRAMIESTRDIVIFALDRQYRYLVFNDAHRRTMRKIWNVDIEPGQSMLDAIGREDDRARAKANFDRALAGEHFQLIEEYGDERYSRRYYEDLYSPITAEDGSVVGLTLFLTDITEQKANAEELEAHRSRLESLVAERTTALMRKEELYRELVTNAPISVVAHKAGAILYANPAAAVLTGQSRESDLSGRRMVDVFGEDIAAAVETYDVVREIVVPRADGTSAEAECRTIRVPYGNDVADLSLLVDVSERKRAEEERRRLDAKMLQTQKLESLGLLSGGIAHDFNNLLVGILGNADLALRDPSVGDNARRFVGRIKTAAQRASELTAQLLTYTGKKPLIVGRLDLSAITQEMTDLIRTSVSANTVLTLDLASDLPAIEGDGSQIRQVVMNLLTNASDAIGETHGEIVLRTSVCEGQPQRDGTSYGETREDRVYVCLEVTDTGIGMDERTRAKMFEPFFTTKEAGRGLGLAAVMGIVRAHGGAIDVKSDPGSGSSFRVFFPTNEPTSERGAASTRSPVTPVTAIAPTAPVEWRGSGTVIVADDEPRVRQVLAIMMSDLGFDVVEAGSAQECLAAFRAHASNVRALLIDLTMPGGGGGEVVRVLRAEGHRDVPIVLSSGYPEDAISRELRGDRHLSFLEKPFDFETFARAMRRAVDR